MTTFLVDYENVHASGIGEIKSDTDDNLVIIFYTDNAVTLNMDLLSKMGQMRMEFIKVPTGSQSLDKHLLSYLGFLVAKGSSEDSFVIVSKDNGYRTVADFWNNYYGTEKVVTLPMEIKTSDSEHAVSHLPSSKEELLLLQMGLRKRIDDYRRLLEEKQPPVVSEITQLNNNLFQALCKKIETSEKCGQIVSAVIGMYKENATKSEMHTNLVKQFGEKDGVKYWNIVKEII